MDELMRTTLRAARDEVEAVVDVDTAWRELTARAEAGDDPVSVTSSAARRPMLRRWPALAAAAAAIAAVAGAVALLDRPDEIRTVDTAPSTVTSSVPTTPPEPTTAPPTTTPPITAVATPDRLPSIAVSYEDLPPVADFDRLVTVSLASPDQAARKPAIGDLGVALMGRRSVTVVAWDGSTREVPIETTSLASPLYGPGDVLYGLDPTRFEFVAIALSGDRAGEVIASAAVAETDQPASGGITTDSLVHGPNGVVAAGRQPGVAVIGYVDVTGAPLEWTSGPLPEFGIVDSLEGSEQSWYSLQMGDRYVETSIRPSPDRSGPTPGPPSPARGPRGTVVLPAALGDSRFSDGTTGPASAIMTIGPDGELFWSTIDPTFEFVASSPWGVLVRRVEPDSQSVTLATLFLEPVVDPATLAADPTGIAPSCPGGLVCGDVAVAPDGTLVSYDPASGELTVHREPGVVAELDPATFLSIAAVGADDTVYVITSPINGTSEEGNDVVAVSMAADRAGLIVRRWEHAIGMSGDSELVATPEGIVVVGCCGMDTVRPEPGAAVVIPWVVREGTEVTLDAPTVRFDQVADVVAVGERSWSLDLPIFAGDRGMPMITATSDGGFVGSFVDWSTPDTATVVRGRPDGTVELTVVSGLPAFVTPDGHVGFAVDGEYVLTDPFTA